MRLRAAALGIAALGDRLAEGAEAERKTHTDGEGRPQHRAANLLVTRSAPEPPLHKPATSSSDFGRPTLGILVGPTGDVKTFHVTRWTTPAG